MITLKEIASLLDMKEEELEKESIETFLKLRLKQCESEIFSIINKYGIKSVEEFEKSYREDRLPEEGTWEDFFRLDHLEAQRDKIKKALEAIG